MDPVPVVKNFKNNINQITYDFHVQKNTIKFKYYLVLHSPSQAFIYQFWLHDQLTWFFFPLGDLESDTDQMEATFEVEAGLVHDNRRTHGKTWDHLAQQRVELVGFPERSPPDTLLSQSHRKFWPLWIQTRKSPQLQLQGIFNPLKMTIYLFIYTVKVGKMFLFFSKLPQIEEPPPILRHFLPWKF